MTLKFKLVGAIRAANLLGAADRCKFWLGKARVGARNRRFQREFPDFATPPSHLAFDAFNHADWSQYRASGMAHSAVFARAILAETPPSPALDVLEWGCGPGRLIRHMGSLLGERAGTITGTDYNEESVAWCRRNLCGIRFECNGLHPPLPFPDQSFDVVYNFSVFTHLSDSVQREWAAELKRVLRPGGLAVCTTHGDAYRYLLASEAERLRYESGDVVVQGNYSEGKKWFFAIHPEAYVRTELLGCFETVRRFPTEATDGVLQDFWIARKQAAAA